MVEAFFEALNKKQQLVPFAELRAATLASFAVMTSLREKAPVELLK